MLSPKLRHRLQVMQQCRPDDIEAVRNRYAALNIPAELLTYIEDMPDRIAEAHLIIARAGASTIAELTAAGRPAILIPLPIATDDHQTANAREMAKAGGARMIPQGEFSPEVLARQIEAIAGDPHALANAAERALSVGRPHATSDLADLVERVAGGTAPLLVGPAGSVARPAMGMGVPA
jgi:UDP-N-acetylglucosamine--N-acetylmuramyl-(pentapeptide) pyrophosphoryl-undecaprenol N-acetylglucosamine transferase